MPAADGDGPVVTEAEVNKLAARAMRAKMMGKLDEHAALEAELARAKASLAATPRASNERVRDQVTNRRASIQACLPTDCLERLQPRP